MFARDEMLAIGALFLRCAVALAVALMIGAGIGSCFRFAP